MRYTLALPIPSRPAISVPPSPCARIASGFARPSPVVSAHVRRPRSCFLGVEQWHSASPRARPYLLLDLARSGTITQHDEAIGEMLVDVAAHERVELVAT